MWRKTNKVDDEWSCYAGEDRLDANLATLGIQQNDNSAMDAEDAAADRKELRRKAQAEKGIPHLTAQFLGSEQKRIDKTALFALWPSINRLHAPGFSPAPSSMGPLASYSIYAQLRQRPASKPATNPKEDYQEWPCYEAEARLDANLATQAIPRNDKSVTDAEDLVNEISDRRKAMKK